MENKYLLLHYERSLNGFLMFWNQNCHGYTDCLGKAGLFSKQQLKKINFDYKKTIPIKPNEIGITMEDVERAQYFKDKELKVVLWNESDLKGQRLIEAVSDLFKERTERNNKLFYE
jgi:hypothetical protein